jgi:hypothetical protein
METTSRRLQPSMRKGGLPGIMSSTSRWANKNVAVGIVERSCPRFPSFADNNTLSIKHPLVNIETPFMRKRDRRRGAGMDQTHTKLRSFVPATPAHGRTAPETGSDGIRNLSMAKLRWSWSRDEECSPSGSTGDWIPSRENPGTSRAFES